MAVSPRRRASRLSRGTDDAETGLSRLDPLFTAVRARYADALHRARLQSWRLRDGIGTVVREACETHGPDDPLVAGLRTIQKEALACAGKSIRRKLTRSEGRVAQLRNAGTPREYVLGVFELAALYGKAGRYDAMIATYDALTQERTRLGFDDAELARLDKLVGDVYYDHGEVTRAMPLLAAAHATNSERRWASDSVDGMLFGPELHLLVSRCYLATGQPRTAEPVLRDVARRLLANDDELPEKRRHRLRHHATYELGSALWSLGRGPEATACFDEAYALAGQSRSKDEYELRIYDNAKTYSLL